MKKTLLISFFFITIIFLNGCAKKLEVIEPPIDFQFVTVKKGDTFESLAKKYTGSEKLAWRIKEFNNSNYLKNEQQLIIPLKPFRRGGLNANGHQLIPVLSYHNFSKGPSKNKLVVSVKSFREQLQHLKSNNFHAITMDQLVEFINFGQVPEKSVLITIDDGWKTSYDLAFPLLKEFGFHATLFIPTDVIDKGEKQIITWNQLQEIVSDNTINIQCHTKSHRDLTTFKKNESFKDYIKSIELDILHSAQKIQSKLGNKVTALAYPYGKTNSLVMALLKKHGYKMAFTVNRKSNPFYNQSFLLNRSMVYGTYNLIKFAKNLKYFEHENIAKIEPIDSLHSLASIALNNPGDFENKKQWRTALLGWKLLRDKLISQKQTRESGKKDSNEQLSAKIELLQKSKQKILQLELKLNNISKQYYTQSLHQIANGTEHKLLFQSLLYSPDNLAPIVLFQKKMGKYKSIEYQVKENDSIKSIAKQLYHDPKKAILIPVFNEHIIDDNSLIPGMKLTLPTIPKRIKRKSNITSSCNVRLIKAPKKLANEYYTKAIKNFDHDQISKAIKNLKTAICLDSEHGQAKEMMQMLKDL